MPADLDATLAALADPERRGVVDLLRVRPHRSGDLADALRVSRPSMSRHLRVLRDAGIVEQEILESDRRVRMVRLRPQPLGDVRRWVEEVERSWCAQLAALESHAEGTGGRR